MKYVRRFRLRFIEVLSCCSVLNSYHLPLLTSLLDIDLSVIENVLDQQTFCIEIGANSYRLYPPFRRYLQSKNEEKIAIQMHQWHLKAELWHQQQGDPREAVYHALFVKDANTVLLNLEMVATELMLSSELETLLDWVAQLRGLGIVFSQHHEGVLELMELWALAFLFKQDEVSKRIEVMQHRLDNDQIFLTDTAYASLLTIKTLNFAFNDRMTEAVGLAQELLSSQIELSDWIKGVLHNVLTYQAILAMNYTAADEYQAAIAVLIER